MAVTRTPNSPYYKINPSGRVPYLACDNGVGLEGSQPVCYFLDHLDGVPMLDAPDGDVGIAYRRLEEYARSLLDGASVWLRELRRAPEDRSATIIEHERQRLDRLADFWEGEIDHPLLQGALNMPQLIRACDGEKVGRVWQPGPTAMRPGGLSSRHSPSKSLKFETVVWITYLFLASFVTKPT